MIQIISKYAPKRKSKLIKEIEIDEELKKIDVTNDYYITPSGTIYREYEEDLYYKIKPYENKHNGYLYVALVIKNGKKKTFRLHRLVAKAYIDNPNNYNIVGHKDNKKNNCNVNNLYWTTNKENIQKAVDDGLLINDKGYEDSQSIPIICYDKNFIEIKRYGSISECHRELKISKSTIVRHCKGLIGGKTRCGYYFRYQIT